MMALRWLTAYDLEQQQPQDRWGAIIDQPNCKSFSTCAHCAARLFQWKWKRWRPWFFRLTYFPQATFGHWTNQVPPRPGIDDRLWVEAYERCKIMGMQNDDYGQFIPGRTTNWREYAIRAEDTQADRDLIHWLKWGTSWGFDETHQPTVSRLDIPAARRKWNALSSEVRTRAINEWHKNVGIGEHEGRPCRWLYPLNFPPTHGVTEQYEITKKELELRRKESHAVVDGVIEYEAIEHDKHRVVSNVSAGSCDLNGASPVETATVYSTPDTLAMNAAPGGTLTRVDEPDAYLHQGTVYWEQSAVTIIVPGSLTGGEDEDYAQSPQWVFGGKFYPKRQMEKANFHLRARARGFGAAQYTDKSSAAVPCDEPGQWTDLIMDDYGTVWPSLDIATKQAAALHELLTTLGPGSKLKKLILISFAAEKDVTIDTSFGGAAFYVYHPMYKVGFYRTEQRKVIKYVQMAQQVLKELYRSRVNGVKGTGRCKFKAWLRLVGCLNYGLYFTRLQHWFIELILEIYPDHPAWDGIKALWTKRGDPCLTRQRKGKRLVVDWMPEVEPTYQHPTHLTPSEVSIEILEKIVREFGDKNGVLIYTGLPLQGRWKGQVQQSNEELMALPRGAYHTQEGIPFFATDATKKVGASVLGREIATVKFDGTQNIMVTEARAMFLGLIHNEHDLLPPPEQRARVDERTWHPSERDCSRFETSSSATPVYKTSITCKAYLAAGRILCLVDNQALAYSWNKRWSMMPQLNADIRVGVDAMLAMSADVATRYIWTKINVADAPTRGKAFPFTQCIWFTDIVWCWLLCVIGLAPNAEGYADAHNARLSKFCSVYHPFEKAVLHGWRWFINPPWTDNMKALNWLLRAHKAGQIFEFAFVLANAPSLKTQRRQSIAKLIQLGAARRVKFPAKRVIFRTKGTRYSDSSQEEPAYKLFDHDCKPLIWSVSVWTTPGMLVPP